MEISTDPAFISCRANAPYDGCFHEPNYFVLKDGEVFPLYVSGKAISTTHWNTPLFDPNDPCEGVELDAFIDYMTDQSYYYEDWETCAVEEACVNDNVHNTVTSLLHNLELPGPTFTCDRCGRELRGWAKYLGYTGNGGVGICLTDPCCEECFNRLRWCDNCFKYVTAEDKQIKVMDGWVDAPRCPNEDEDEAHALYPAEDEAAKFGMDGSQFLHRAEGPPPVIVIMQKG